MKQWGFWKITWVAIVIGTFLIMVVPAFAQPLTPFQQWQQKWSIKVTPASLPRIASPVPSGRLKAIERHVGLHERKNRSTIRKIIGVDPRRTPWCGYAVAYALKANGEQPVKGYPRAFNWKRYGKAVSLRNAPAGAIVVYRHSHVAILKSRSGPNHHIACGGNMSNRFKCSRYRNSSIVAVRL